MGQGSTWAPRYLPGALGPSLHLTEPPSVSLGFWAGLRGAGKGYVFAQVRCPSHCQSFCRSLLLPDVPADPSPLPEVSKSYFQFLKVPRGPLPAV